MEEFYKQKWVKAQPHNEDIREKSEKFFIKSFDNKDIFLNTDEGINSFLEFIKKKDKGLILIKGKRGSGKTFTMNYILNLYTKELQKNNIFWVRANLFSIYEIKKDKLKCNIQDYLAEKLLRICLKYSHYENDICKELRKFIEDYININNSATQKEQYLYTFITEKFKDIQENFNENFGEGSTKEFLLKVIDIFSEFMDHKYDPSGKKIDWNSLEDEYNSVSKLKDFEFRISINNKKFHILELLITFITEIKKRKLLLILDSMDNVDYLMKESSFKELMKQLNDFISFCGKLDNVLVVISGRYETFGYLQQNDLWGENLRKDPKEFIIAPINVGEFLNKRLDYIKSKPSDFKKFVENYVSLFYNCIYKKINASISRENKEEEFIREFYDYSYRDIYDDLIHNFSFLKYYIGQKCSDCMNRATYILEDEVITNNEIYVKSKNNGRYVKPISKTYILNQGSYTSGCVYRGDCNIVSQGKDFRSGHKFFNLFESFDESFEKDNKDNKIHIPFLYLNVLSFVVEKYGINAEFSSSSICKDFFENIPAKYLVTKEYLDKVLRRLVEYSILETIFCEEEIRYRITNKARYLLKLVKSDPYLIHTLILDTKLPKDIFDKIKLHKNDYSDIGEAIFRNVIVAVQTINSVSEYLYKQTIFNDKDINNLAKLLYKSSIMEDKKNDILGGLSGFKRDDDTEYDVYFIFSGKKGRGITRRIVKNLLIRNPYMRIFFDEFRDNDELKKTKSIVIIHNKDLENEIGDMDIFEFLKKNKSVELPNEISNAINEHKGFVFILKSRKFKAKWDYSDIEVEKRLITTNRENLINTIIDYLNKQKGKQNEMEKMA